jgi:hypothetical protein
MADTRRLFDFVARKRLLRGAPRVKAAIRYVTGIGLSAILMLTAADANAEVLIHVYRAFQQMTVTVHGSPYAVWAVSTARRGYRTPAGNFRPKRLEPVWYSSKYESSPIHAALDLLRRRICDPRQLCGGKPGASRLAWLRQALARSCKRALRPRRIFRAQAHAHRGSMRADLFWCLSTSACPEEASTFSDHAQRSALKMLSPHPHLSRPSARANNPRFRSPAKS